MDVMYDYNQQVFVVISRFNMKPELLLGIYASTNYKLQWVLWVETPRLVELDLPSLVARDFNYIEGGLRRRGRKAILG